MPTPDQRTVGELLHDADVAARMLLLDVDALAAPGLVSTWPEVVEAGVDLWRAFPPTSPHVGGLAGADVDQLEAIAGRAHTSQLHNGTPAADAFDRRLVDVAVTLARATDLVTRHGTDIRPVKTPAAQRDLEAARMCVLHTMYITTHAVAVSVREHARWAQDVRGPRHAYQLAESGRALDRLAAFEQLVGSYIGTRYIAVLAGKVVERPEDGTRLEEALVGWDIQAHRSLAANPTGANLALVARTQATVAFASLAILDAAAVAEHIDPDDYAQRLSPALQASQQTWSIAASRWTELTTPASPTSPDLVLTERELRAAVRQITHDQQGWAAPELVAQRVDLTETARLLERAMAAAVDVAHLTHEIAATDDHLQGPARAMNKRAMADADLIPRRQVTDPLAAWVPARDLLANRMVPLPEPVRAGLVAATDGAARAATRLASAATCLGATTTTDLGRDPLARAQRMDVVARASTQTTRRPACPWR